MSQKILLIRADASLNMGTGHVMRCLALAQAWQDTGGRAMLATVMPTSSLRERLIIESIETVEIYGEAGTEEDAKQTAALASQHSATWVVVDGYQFGADYQRALSSRGLRILFLDDYGHAASYSADLILNQNITAGEELYQNRESYTRLLLGPQYCLLRRQFMTWREWRREIPDSAREILITMGGTDPDNLTGPSIETVMRTGIPELEATVVVGADNPHAQILEQLCSESRGAVRIVRSPCDMPKIMACADMALSVAGGTLWELLFMGCPVLSYARSPTQEAIVAELAKNGVAEDLGEPRFDMASPVTAIAKLAASSAHRGRMSALGRELVDGRGASRVCELLTGEKIVTQQFAVPRSVW